MDCFLQLCSSVKWEGGVRSDPRYQQIDGQLRITNVDRNRDQGGWLCSVQTTGGELARREVSAEKKNKTSFDNLLPASHFTDSLFFSICFLFFLPNSKSFRSVNFLLKKNSSGELARRKVILCRKKRRIFYKVLRRLKCLMPASHFTDRYLFIFFFD